MSNSQTEMSLTQKLKKKCVQLLSSSTFHGVPKIISSETCLQKLFWTAIILAMYGYFSASVINNVLEYLKYPVVTNINTVYEKEATFPAVEVCKSSDVLNQECKFNTKQCRGIKIRNSGCNVFNRGINDSYYPIEILKSAIPGKNNGLTLHLYPKRRESQIELYLYNQSTDYDINKAIFISIGMEVNLVLNRVFSSKLSSPYSNCKKEYVFEQKPLDILNQTSYPYFQSECFLLCKYEQRMEICNRTAEFNSFFQYYFTNRHQFWNFYYKEYDVCHKKDPSLIYSIDDKFVLLGSNTICEKQCPIECDAMSYSISSLSNSLYTDYSIVNIYYEDFYYTSITEEPKTTFDNLIGTIGGLLGLFLGASLISFYEIIDLVISIIYISIQSYTSKKSQVSSTTIPSHSVLKFLRI